MKASERNAEIYERLQVFRGLPWISPVCKAAAERLQQKLRESALNLVFIGQYKRGKSSLINALLGKKVLPTGALPLTSVVTVVRYGNEGAKVVYVDGRTEIVEQARLDEFIAEEKNPKNEKQVRIVEVYSDLGLLASGTRIIDTPGIDSMHAHNSETTLSYLPDADAAVLVLSADQPLSAQEMQFLQMAHPNLALVLVALNKIDLLSADEMVAVVKYINDSLNKAFPNARFEVFPVSSKWALESKEEASGVAILRARFDRLVREEKHGMEQVAAEQKFEKLLEAEFSILRARRKFLLETEEGRIQKSRELSKIVASADEAERVLALSFQAEFRDVMNQFNRYNEKVEAAALRHVEDPLEKMLPGPGMSSHGYIRRAYSIVRDSLGVAIKQAEPRLWQFIEEKYGDLLSRYHARVESLLENTSTAAAQALALELPQREVERRVSFVSMKASFNPSLHATTLGGIFLFVISCLPMKASHRFLREHLRQVVKDAVATNFENVRWELVRILEKDFRLVAADFTMSVDQIKHTLEIVVQTSTAQNRTALHTGQEEISVIADRNLALQSLYALGGRHPLESISR